MLGHQMPVEPTRLVILAVGVVVATLAASHLIAHNKHGHAAGQHQGCEKVFHLPVAKPLYCGIVGWTFKAAVPASVLVTSVSVVLTILLVVLVVVGDHIVQCEAVVARNEIDGFFELALFPTIDAGA